MSNLVTRLLRRNISAGQLAGYLLANLVGLAIVLTAIQFYNDVKSATGGDDSFISRDYLIISKRVDGLGSLMGKSLNFSPGEIGNIKKQPWAARVGEFTAANYNVWASVDLSGRKMSTSLFLEAIPSEYFDVTPPGWGYTPGKPVPIIISKDYLTLYNFGYASTHGLPQISESMVSMVPLRLSLSGNGRQDWVDARIVGFSSRLNTIAVPLEFLEATNSLYAEEKQPDPSRLIIELNSAGDPAATAYLESHGYEAAGDKADNGRAAFFLSVVTSVVIGIGLIISALSFFILLLSIYLLLQKNRDKLHRLMELGYTPGEVARPYYRMVIFINLLVLALAIALMLVGRHFWSGPLASLGSRGASPLAAIVIGVALIAFVTLLDIIAIRRRVAAAFRL